MSHTGSEMVPLVIDEDLRFVFEPSPRRRVDYPLSISFEWRSVGVFRFVVCSAFALAVFDGIGGERLCLYLLEELSVSIHHCSSFSLLDFSRKVKGILILCQEWNETLLGGSEKRRFSVIFANAFIWQPDRDIESGVYVIRAYRRNTSITKRVVYLK